MAHYDKDIVANYGAPINGDNSSPAWDDWNTFLSGLNPGDTFTLTVPAHTYDFDPPGTATPLAVGILGGISGVVNVASGASFTGNFGLGPASGIPVDTTNSSRIATVNAGATSVTLLTAAEYTRFPVNRWIAVAGLDMQGYGNPPNPAFFEYRKITAIDSGTGVISFSTPLAQQYLSTWPLYDANLGGPATIFAMPENWDLDVTYNVAGCTLHRSLVADEIIYAKARRVTINGGTVPVSGISPSANQYFEHNPESSSFVEVDKMVETLVYGGGGAIDQLFFQSMSCATDCTINNVTIDLINGTPRNLTLSNGATVGELRIGTAYYGRTDSITVNDSVVSAVTLSTRAGDTDTSGYTISGSTIRRAIASGVPAWAVPGTWCQLAGGQENERIFMVLNVTTDATDIIIGTTLTGVSDLSVYDIYVHACPVWRASNSSGCADIADLCNPGAQGRPIFSYSKRTYTGNTFPVDFGYFSLWGALVSAQFSVTQAYAGTQSSLSAQALGPSGGNFMSEDRSSGVRYNPIVDLKTTGVRLVLPGGPTGSVGADSLGSAQGNLWFSGSQGIAVTHDVSGEAPGLWPIIEIELIGNQGISTGFILGPLALRLHS